MKILLDIAGADKGISASITAAVNVVDKIGIPICLVGKKEDVQNELKKMKKEDYLGRFEILECTEYITNNDSPVQAIKTKKGSNIVTAYNYMKENKDTVFISASNTGAVMAGALLKLGRIEKVHRPALASVLPTQTGGNVILLDTGANPEAKEISLIQYAKLGEIYAKCMFDNTSPKIALLNIGAEDEKGTPMLKSVNAKLREIYGDMFIGNIESRYMLTGDADIIVADGLLGNIALKSLEGAVSTIKKALKEEFTKNIFNKIKAVIMSKMLKNIMHKFNYKEREGAVLLGVKSPVIKVHGSSSSVTYEKALYQAKKLLENDVIGKIIDKMNEEKQI